MFQEISNCTLWWEYETTEGTKDLWSNDEIVLAKDCEFEWKLESDWVSSCAA